MPAKKAQRRVSSGKPRQKPMTAAEVRLIVQDVLMEHDLHSVPDIARKAATEAVQQTLLTLGVDTTNPLQAQATFVALKNLVHTFASEEMQADLAHLRAWRQTTTSLKSKSMMTIVGAVTAGILALVWTGFIKLGAR